MKRQDGFSLIELMIAMTVFILAMAATSNVFLSLLTQFKQQSKIAESGMENIVGFEIMRSDLEQAGSGLAWIIPAGVGYLEAIGATASFFNDAPANPPMAFTGDDGVVAMLNASDYLVVKAVNVVSNNVAQRWTRLGDVDNNGIEEKRNGLSGDNFDPLDNVIVLDPGTNDSNARTLVVNGAAFATTYNAMANYVPAAPQTNIVYGLDTAGSNMPFNRADYYISTANVPSTCAPGTGVLVKGEVSQVDGTITELSLIDCVADFQVGYQLDVDDDGVLDIAVNNLTLSGITTAQTARNQIREVRIYVLAHEGQRHADYNFPVAMLTVGETILGTNLGRNFDLTTIADYQDYRWKVHNLAIRPDNLR